MGEYSKIDTVKTMGTPRKINAIWWNIKINLQKLVDIRSYELPINLQSFTQKDLTEVNIFQKVLGGGAYFYRNTRYVLHMVLRAHSVIYNMYDSSTYKNIRKWQMNAQ